MQAARPYEALWEGGAALVAANGIYKLAVIGTVATQQHIHTLHFRTTLNALAAGATEPEFMGSLIDLWSGTPMAAYRALFGSTDKPVEQFQVRKVCGDQPLPAGVDEANPAGSQAGTGVAGEFNGDAAAPWLASITTVRTALAGRRFRGRWFFGGLWEPMLSGSSVSSDRQNRMQTYCTNLDTVFMDPAAPVNLPAVLFVYSKVQSQETGTQCQNAGADVTSFQVRPYLVTMKSRKIGSGI
jgi:hypothetical protein